MAIGINLGDDQEPLFDSPIGIGSGWRDADEIGYDLPIQLTEEQIQALRTNAELDARWGGAGNLAMMAGVVRGLIEFVDPKAFVTGRFVAQFIGQAAHYGLIEHYDGLKPSAVAIEWYSRCLVHLPMTKASLWEADAVGRPL